MVPIEAPPATITVKPPGRSCGRLSTMQTCVPVAGAAMRPRLARSGREQLNQPIRDFEILGRLGPLRRRSSGFMGGGGWGAAGFGEFRSGIRWQHCQS